MKRPSPPLLFVVLVVAQVGLSIVSGRAGILGSPWWTAAGALALLLGVGLHLRAERVFRSAGTTRATHGRPRTLVTHDVYARTRNPMYLGGAVFLLGLALLLGSAAAFLVLPLYLVAAARWYIRPEEDVLLRHFGEAWTEYRDGVRRWL